MMLFQTDLTSNNNVMFLYFFGFFYFGWLPCSWSLFDYSHFYAIFLYVSCSGRRNDSQANSRGSYIGKITFIMDESVENNIIV